MAQRTSTVGRTLTDGSGAPRVGAPITATLLVPGGINPTDGTGTKGISKKTLGLSTDNTGTYSFTLDYTGDFLAPDPATDPCTWQINEDGTLITAPYGYSYASSIDPGTWVATLPSGTLPMVFTLATGDGLGVAAVTGQVWLSLNGSAGTVTYSATRPIGATADAGGRMVWHLKPQSSITPTGTTFRLIVAGEPLTYTFTVPTTPTGYQGAWNGTTTYHVHSGAAYDPLAAVPGTPPDTVLSSGVYYVATADSLNHVPPNASYWAVWAEPILWHLTAAVVANTVSITPLAIAHDAGVAPVSGAPYSTPTTLDHDLRNLVYAIDTINTLVPEDFEGSLPVQPQPTGSLFWSQDTNLLFISDGSNWWKTGPFVKVLKLITAAVLYSPITAHDWLGAANTIATGWSLVGGTLSAVVDVADVFNFFSFTSGGSGNDWTVLGTFPSTGSDYHAIFRWALGDPGAALTLLRFGLTSTSDLSDGVWYEVDTADTQYHNNGTTTDLSLHPSGTLPYVWNYCWVCIEGGHFKVRVSTNGTTFFEKVNVATTTSGPTNAGFRFQSSGSEQLWFNWIQLANAAPSGVTVI